MTWTKHVRIVNTLKGEKKLLSISFGTSILPYPLRSTIFTLVQLSPIYLFLLNRLVKMIYDIPF